MLPWGEMCESRGEIVRTLLRFSAYKEMEDFHYADKEIADDALVRRLLGTRSLDCVRSGFSGH